jgi:hypothetical protein
VSRDLTICMECGKKASLVDGKRIYPHRPDLFAKSFFLCECGAYVGCHKGTKNPLGYPAGDATRRARSAAHAAFDPLWKTRTMPRSEAYKWLADRLGQTAGETHISWMDAATARRVVEVCSVLRLSPPATRARLAEAEAAIEAVPSLVLPEREERGSSSASLPAHPAIAAATEAQNSAGWEPSQAEQGSDVTLWAVVLYPGSRYTDIGIGGHKVTVPNDALQTSWAFANLPSPSSLPCAASERGKASGAESARTEPHSSVLTDTPCQSEKGAE